ncbi:lipid IV(A) 3-deoxy-D-manno-octulosonic acid transferase [Chitinimonas sp. BJB300]|uniref:lipid IV(A) 3-deoxy-D-manno-octulosonic acid transferase n=1 Tax=Chitinimonas sp. BJB300 TaxID=1559339 RepID=UPI000C11B1BB|nr:lipid IV(A) 3-deoxy-D-manno-octulosonic acid transferase [Chitinimonas sp. BJB300]PHV12342.1 3-deoxy-D-manno-octulosonic acid transferase [Chitinimonas sp. BJB300]TSJ91644.1 3-deoxy-D-manno-octulosonic acid transferase [Chitinimonas sp. BJB300]
MLWRVLYSLAWYLVLPWAFFYLWRRGAKQPAYRHDWRERLGYYPSRPTAPVIWLHAVSVGETRAAAVLVQALQQRHPDHHIVLTQMTPTGRDTARQLFGDHPNVSFAYLPYDLPDAVHRFLRHFRPRFGILMEMEIWPNLIHGAASANVALYLLNARLSEKSLRGYLKTRCLVGPAMLKLAGIAAQGEDDARRIRQLAALNPIVSGNIKFDMTVDPSLLALGQQWRQQFGQRPVWIAASTREGEEALLLDALAQVKLPDNSLLLLVPRHPQRFDEVATLLAQRGWTTQKRSAWSGDTPLPTEITVLLGDSLGELAAYYAAADVAFVGGSLLPFGCHSVIEPCAQGIPVLIGPSSFNFADAVREAVALGAIIQCHTATVVVQEVAHLLSDTDTRQQMRAAGLAFVGKHQGAVQRAMALLP